VDEWQAVLAVEGTPTGDGRLFELGSITWRDLPLTLGYMSATFHGDEGQVIPIGRIDTIERVSTGEGTADIIGRGPFLDSEDTQVMDAIATVQSGAVRGVSVDAILDLFMVAPFDEGVTPVTEEGEDLPEPDPDGDGEAEALFEEDVWLQVENVVTLRVQKATITAATVVPTPAFAEAMIEPVGQAAVASAAAPAVPPRDWFDDPHLDAPTPLTVTAEGRVYGHLASWGTCHIGMPGCFTAPPSPTGYAMFRLGERETDGGPVAVGQITMDANHADLTLTAARAREHYEHTGAAVADVAAGEDEYGIWVAGALRPDVTPEDVVALRAAKLSGDWRNQGQGLDLVGALAVNVPGFPIPRGVVAGGDRDEPVSLVAAGLLRQATQAVRIAGRVTRVRRAATAAAFTVESDGESVAIAALADRMHERDLRSLAARASAPALEALAERV
jgi:hypothetical protein